MLKQNARRLIRRQLRDVIFGGSMLCTARSVFKTNFTVEEKFATLNEFQKER